MNDAADWMKKHWRPVAVCAGSILTVAILYFGFFRGTAEQPKPAAQDPTKKIVTPEEKQDEIRRAEKRIANCEAYVRSTGSHPEALHEIARARKELEEYRQTGEEHKLNWMDGSLHDAYQHAQAPALVANMLQRIGETSSYVDSLVTDRNVSARLWKHTQQAREYAKLFSSGGGRKFAVLVDAELAHVRRIAEGGAAPARVHPMVTTLDNLLDAEQKAEEWEHKNNLRVVAHAKQARRYFNAAVRYFRNEDLSMKLAAAEADYALKIAAHPDFVVSEPKDEEEAKKDEITVWLKLVDRFVTQMQRVEKEMPNSEEALKVLLDVRKTFDFVLEQSNRGMGYSRDHYWVRQSLDEVDRMFRRAEEARTVQKLETPYDTEFQAWFDQYLKDNPQTWIKNQKLDVYLVNSESVGKDAAKRVIAEREHMYLKTTYKGRAVLAVLSK